MKKCSLCNTDLLVYWDTEGEEVCDDCFFQSPTQIQITLIPFEGDEDIQTSTFDSNILNDEK